MIALSFLSFGKHQILQTSKFWETYRISVLIYMISQYIESGVYVDCDEHRDPRSFFNLGNVWWSNF